MKIDTTNNEHPWTSIQINENPQTFMNINKVQWGNSWKPIKINEHLQNAMNEHPWKSNEIYEHHTNMHNNRWTSLNINEPPWQSIKIDEHSWQSINKHLRKYMNINNKMKKHWESMKISLKKIITEKWWNSMEIDDNQYKLMKTCKIN